MRKFKLDTILVATGNPGKAREIKELLKTFNVKVEDLSGRNIAEPEEDGTTFMENAAIKAAYYSKMTGLPALADDSGLCVDCLDGAPGIYSARWAGKEKDFFKAMERVWIAFARNPNTKANFTCAMALCWPDGHIEGFEGHVYGNLTFPPRGDKGFGYDPIFTPDGYDMTFGQMDADIKQKISHRTDAFAKLIDGCFKETGHASSNRR